MNNTIDITSTQLLTLAVFEPNTCYNYDFSLCACVVTTFALSAWMNPNKKFVMEHIQNATLAGGVAIGAVADLLVGPWAALTIGSMAGMICVFGFNCITVKQYLQCVYVCKSY